MLTSGTSYTVPSGATTMKAWIITQGGAVQGRGGVVAWKTFSVTGGSTINYVVQAARSTHVFKTIGTLGSRTTVLCLPDVTQISTAKTTNYGTRYTQIDYGDGYRSIVGFSGTALPNLTSLTYNGTTIEAVHDLVGLYGINTSNGAITFLTTGVNDYLSPEYGGWSSSCDGGQFGGENFDNPSDSAVSGIPAHSNIGGAIGGNASNKGSPCYRYVMTDVSDLKAALSLAGVSTTESCGATAAFGSGGSSINSDYGPMYSPGIGGGNGDNASGNSTGAGGSGAIVLMFS